MFASEQSFRPRTLGFIFLGGVMLFLLMGWAYLANYNYFFDESPRHIMQGIGTYLLAAVGLAVAVLAAFMWFFLYPRCWLWLIYKNGWKVGNLLYTRECCEHVWERDPERPHNSAKRYCPKCGSHESLFQKPYPAAGEAKYNWRSQNFDELRFL